MKNTTANKILLVILAVLGLAGFILLLVSMFGNVASNLPLTGALACVGIAGVINTVLLVKKGRESKN